MNAADVVSLYTELQKLNIHIWVDGGWGVDALLGEQTRPHEDLDIAIQELDIPHLQRMLDHGILFWEMKAVAKLTFT
jgi:lincosamide nucleotidyltransferase A/C/D/E